MMVVSDYNQRTLPHANEPRMAIRSMSIDYIIVGLCLYIYNTNCNRYSILNKA